MVSVPGTAFAQAWSYADGSGNTVTVDHVPTRIIASQDAAAGLIPLGIRPVGIYVDGPVKDDPSLRGLNLTGIEILGEAWGEIDIERLAAAKPDLIIAEYWPLEKAYSGMKDGRIVAKGAPRDVVTSELVGNVFGLSARIVTDPVSETPMVVPLGRHHIAVAAE